MEPDAQQQVREFWNHAGPQIPHDFHVAYSADGIPPAVRFSYGPEAVVPHGVVVYNWSNEPSTVRLPFTAPFSTGRSAHGWFQAGAAVPLASSNVPLSPSRRACAAGGGGGVFNCGSCVSGSGVVILRYDMTPPKGTVFRFR